jgi:hypothetical protein
MRSRSSENLPTMPPLPPVSFTVGHEERPDRRTPTMPAARHGCDAFIPSGLSRGPCDGAVRPVPVCQGKVRATMRVAAHRGQKLSYRLAGRGAVLRSSQTAPVGGGLHGRSNLPVPFPLHFTDVAEGCSEHGAARVQDKTALPASPTRHRKLCAVSPPPSGSTGEASPLRRPCKPHYAVRIRHCPNTSESDGVVMPIRTSIPRPSIQV